MMLYCLLRRSDARVVETFVVSYEEWVERNRYSTALCPMPDYSWPRERPSHQSVVIVTETEARDLLGEAPRGLVDGYRYWVQIEDP